MNLLRRKWCLCNTALLLGALAILLATQGCGDARLVDTGPQEDPPPVDVETPSGADVQVESRFQESRDWYDAQQALLQPWVHGLLPSMLEGLTVEETIDEAVEEPPKRYSFPRGAEFDPFFETVDKEDVLWSPFGDGASFDSVFSVYVLETEHTKEEWIFIGREAPPQEVFFKLDIDSTREDEDIIGLFEKLIVQSAGHETLPSSTQQMLRRQQAFTPIDDSGSGSVKISLNSEQGNPQKFRAKTSKGGRIDKFEFGLCLSKSSKNFFRSRVCTKANDTETMWFKIVIHPRIDLELSTTARVKFTVDVTSPSLDVCKCIYQRWDNGFDADIIDIATGGRYTHGDGRNDRGCLPTKDFLFSDYTNPWDIRYGSDSRERAAQLFEMDTVLLNRAPGQEELEAYRIYFNWLDTGVDTLWPGEMTEELFERSRSKRRRELITKLRQTIPEMRRGCEGNMDIFDFSYSVDGSIGIDLVVDIDLFKATHIEPPTSAGTGPDQKKDEFGDPDNKVILASPIINITPIPGLVIVNPTLFWTYDLFKTEVGALLKWNGEVDAGAGKEANPIETQFSFSGGWEYNEEDYIKRPWKSPESYSTNSIDTQFKPPFVRLRGSTEVSVGIGVEFPIKVLNYAGPYIEAVAGAKVYAKADINPFNRDVTCALGYEVGAQSKAGVKAGFRIAGRTLFDLFDYAFPIFNTCAPGSPLATYCLKDEYDCSGALTLGEPKRVDTVIISAADITPTADNIIPSERPPGAAIDEVFIKRGQEDIPPLKAHIGSQNVLTRVLAGDFEKCDYSSWENSSVFLERSANHSDKLVLRFAEPLQPGDTLYVRRHSSSGSTLGNDEDVRGWGCQFSNEITIEVGSHEDNDYESIYRGRANFSGKLSDRYFY